MTRLLNRQELIHEIRTTLVQICTKAVSEGFVARVEGLIGITLENNNVFLVNIHEDFIDSKLDHFADHEHHSSNDPLFDDQKVEALRNFHVAEGILTPEVSHSAIQRPESQKEVSKLDMLMRYSNSLFDQFTSGSFGRQQNMRDYVPSREQRTVNQKQQQQLGLTDDHPREIQSLKEFKPHAAQCETDLSFSDQNFSVKEEPISEPSFEDSVNCGDTSSKALSWPCLSDRIASASRSSSTPQQDAKKIAGYGEAANPADQKSGEAQGYEFLRQPWMGGNSFEAFGAPNDSGEGLESRPYVCELCDASFSKKFCLANHIVTIHQVGGKYVCKHCGKQFLQKLRYLTHVDRHNNIRRHICQLCGKAFSYKYSLWSHAKKCLGNMPGFNESMFSTQVESAFPIPAEPSFSTQVELTNSTHDVDDAGPVEDASET